MKNIKLIEHNNNQPLVLVRKEYIDLCKGNISAAIILATIEYWIEYKVNKNLKPNGTIDETVKNIWLYKSHEQIIQDSLGLLKNHDVICGLKYLIDNNLLFRRNNPKVKYDRTYQYQLNIQKIRDALPNGNNSQNPEKIYTGNREEEYEEDLVDNTNPYM